MIILGYNGLEYVDKCIRAVLDQDYPAQNYEVVWADNASTDGSPDYVEEHFPDVRVLKFAINYGFAEGNNRAAKETQGRYLVFLNQDTIVHRGWLRALMEAMAGHDDLAACQANMLMPWHTGFETFDRVGYPGLVHYQDLDRYGCVVYKDHPMQEALIPSIGLAGASFIIDRHIMEFMPYLFDPLFGTNAEDLDLALRLGVMGYRIAVAPRAIVYHLQYSRISGIRSAYRRAYTTARNRILAHYKAMPGRQFLRSLPRFLFGGVVKMRELHFDRNREFLVMALMVPISFAALLGAIRLMPTYRGYKHRTMEAPDWPFYFRQSNHG